ARGRVRHNLAAFRDVRLTLNHRQLLRRLAANMAAVGTAGVRLRSEPLWAEEARGGAELLGSVFDALACGRGAILVSGHLGFWQLPVELVGRRARTWLMDPSSGRLMPVGTQWGDRAGDPGIPLDAGLPDLPATERDGWE